jgi:predicted metalloprotease
MRFNPKARLDRGRVKDTGRGSGGGGLPGGSSRRIPIPGGAAGGGIGGILIVVLIIVVNQFLGGDDPSGAGGYSASRFNDAADSGRYDHCKTGADANEDHDCARVAVENSLTDYWEGELGRDFRAIEQLVTFTGQVNTQCGGASSDVGPFYCPANESVYLDTDFFDEVLERQLGGPDGGFVEFYVLAHEYGHHISNLLGFFGRVRTQQGPQSDAVRLELQADCYAGMWAHHAKTTKDAAGDVLIEDLSEEDIDLAIAAAEAVGDDRIQQKTQGQVTEESWTHGSAAMRKRWFGVGYAEGELEACDTFAAGQV